MEMLQYPFMQKALLVGMLIGTLCPSIGLFLVMRRLSMVGDTLAHVSLAGVLLATFWSISPLPVALSLSLLVSILMEKLRKFYRYYSEISLSIIMASGLGIAVILMGLAKSSDASISGILFGSIITLQNQDIIVISILSAITCIFMFVFYRELLFIAFDEEKASLAGIRVDLFSYLLLLMAAMVISIGLRVVGALLVSSLMVIPVAAALIIRQGFKRTLIFANIFGLISVLIGLTASFTFDFAPGGTIVVTSVILLLIVLGLNSLRNTLIRRIQVKA